MEQFDLEQSTRVYTSAVSVDELVRSLADRAVAVELSFESSADSILPVVCTGAPMLVSFP